MSEKPTIQHATDIPDLMNWDDYEGVELKKHVRVRIRVTEEGIEIIADSPYPQLVEELLARLDPKVIEKMLCG